MSVDFYPCNNCDEVYCDCGFYIQCDCGTRWCSVKCSDEEGYLVDENDEKSCGYCRLEILTDSELLDFILKEYSISKEEAMKRWKNQEK